MSRNKKTAIIKQSIDLFRTKGYQQTSMDDICNAVGITVGTLYYYINSKEDILFEIHEQFINVVIDDAKQEMAVRQGCSAKEKLEGILRVYIKLMRDYQAEITVFFQEMDHLNGENFKKIEKKRKVFSKLILELINEGAKNGEFTAANEKVIALSLIGMINWMYKWYNPNGSLSIHEISDTMIKLVLDGLMPRFEKKEWEVSK